MAVTVLQRAATGDLTTLDRLKSETGVTDGAQDQRLRALIHEASAAIARYCRRDTFGRERVLQTEFGSAWGACYRPAASVVLQRDIEPSIVSVFRDGASLASGWWVLDGSILRFADGAGRLRPLWWRSLEITYDAGYHLMETLPYDLERVCLDLCRSAEQARTRDPALRSVQVLDLVTKTYFAPSGATSITEDFAARLEPYRYVSVSP